jgi:hypothetical protein
LHGDVLLERSSGNLECNHGKSSNENRSEGAGPSEPNAEQRRAAILNETTIAARAYEFWQQRDCAIGSPEEDWFRAEEELKSKESVRIA